MTAPSLNRRNSLILAALVGGGYGAAQLMQAAAPLARDVSGNMIAAAALDDPDCPAGGAQDGNLVVALYTDYRCPACRQGHKAMKAALHDDGKVRLLYKDYPIFGEISENAAALAIASNYQGIYETLHDRLMTGPASVDTNDIRQVVATIGGDWTRLENDRRTNAHAIQKRLGRVANEAFGLGIAGTPAYLIGTQLVNGALSANEFTQVFKAARKQA